MKIRVGRSSTAVDLQALALLVLGLGWLLVRDVGRELKNWRLALSAAVVVAVMKLVGLV
jgi:hypothetical protein